MAKPHYTGDAHYILGNFDPDRLVTMDIYDPESTNFEAYRGQESRERESREIEDVKTNGYL